MKSRPTWTEALQKLERFCAYQDRCHQEVRFKLLDLGVYGDELEEIIAQLISDGFLNESRFARSYVRGKFRIKKWGRIRIRQELKRRNISEYCIREGMGEIEEAAYAETLQELLLQKASLLNEPDVFKKKQKLARYVISKGFEPDIVWNVLTNLD